MVEGTLAKISEEVAADSVAQGVAPKTDYRTITEFTPGDLFENRKRKNQEGKKIRRENI